MKKLSALKETKTSKKKPAKRYLSSEKNVQSLGVVSQNRVAYDPAFHPEDFIQHCREGQTFTMIASAWGVHTQTVINWSKKYTEFKRAFRLGKQMHTAFWQDKIRSNILREDEFQRLDKNGKKTGVYLSKFKLLPFMWYSRNTMGWSDEGGDDFQGANAKEYTFHDQDTDEITDAQGNPITVDDE